MTRRQKVIQIGGQRKKTIKKNFDIVQLLSNKISSHFGSALLEEVSPSPHPNQLFKVV